jgi:site-specific DNA-cytosine methylase
MYSGLNSNMIAVDIFTGSGSFKNVCRSLGIECLSIDNRRRKGTCEPDLRLDILNVPGTFFESMQPDIMWFGLPCTVWSNASHGFHLDSNFNPKTELAEISIQILHRVFDIINESKPKIWFIENPRGRLKNYPGLIEFLKKCSGHIYTCTLSSYGFPTTKPTNIITNYPELKLKPLDAFGRGAKVKVTGTFDNLTTVQRQKTPELLIRSILEQVIIR